MPKIVENVTLAPFDPRQDAERLAAWLRAPHVSRWWGDPDTQLKSVLKEPVGGEHALIVADDVPVGYVRWEKASRAELQEAGLHEIPDGTVDIDIAIGELAFVGSGVASRALKIVVEKLISAMSLPMIMMATSVENKMAIRAYEKAGFRRVRVFNDPEYGQMWLFSFEGRSAV